MASLTANMSEHYISTFYVHFAVLGVHFKYTSPSSMNDTKHYSPKKLTKLMDPVVQMQAVDGLILDLCLLLSLSLLKRMHKTIFLVEILQSNRGMVWTVSMVVQLRMHANISIGEKKIIDEFFYRSVQPPENTET